MFHGILVRHHVDEVVALLTRIKRKEITTIETLVDELDEIVVINDAGDFSRCRSYIKRVIFSHDSHAPTVCENIRADSACIPKIGNPGYK